MYIYIDKNIYVTAPPKPISSCNLHSANGKPSSNSSHSSMLQLNYSDTTQNPKKGSFLEGKWDPITSGKSR